MYIIPITNGQRMFNHGGTELVGTDWDAAETPTPMWHFDDAQYAVWVVESS